MSTQVEEVDFSGPIPCQVDSSALESQREKSSKLGPPIRALDNDVNHVKQGAKNSPASNGEKEPGDAGPQEKNWIDWEALPTDPHERQAAMFAIMQKAEQEALDAGLWPEEGEAPDGQEPVWLDRSMVEEIPLEKSVQLNDLDFDPPEGSSEGERLAEPTNDNQENLLRPEVDNFFDSMQPSNEDETVAKKRGKPNRGRLDARAKTMVCSLIKHGFNRDQAARFVGVHPSTITKATRRCEEFDKSLRTAETLREFDALGDIMRAGRRSWRASAWLLERMAPQYYVRSLSRDRVVLRLAMGRFADTVCRKLELDEKIRKQMEGWIETVAEECR